MLAYLAWFIPIGGSSDDDGPNMGVVLLMLILGPHGRGDHPDGDQPEP